MKGKILIISSVISITIMLYGIRCSHTGVIPSSWVGICFIIFFVTAVLTLLNILLSNVDEEKLRLQKLETYRNELKIMYFNSLNNGDKEKSLIFGREYYGSYGIYDEQRIQNDLLCFLKKNNHE